MYLLIHILISCKERMGLLHVYHCIFVILIIREGRVRGACGSRDHSQRKRRRLAPKSMI